MEVTLVLALGGAAAGLFGALLGLGGGILIVPLLTIGFGLPVREAVGVSLVCVIMTSGAAAGVYLQRHLADLRLGMTLESFTVAGALLGALTAFLLPAPAIAGLFAGLLVYTAVAMVRGVGSASPEERLLAPAEGGLAPAEERPPAANGGRRGTEGVAREGYRIRHLGFGLLGSLGAGVVSALLGVGGGIVKVPLMHLVMGVPLRVATATSNLMIGVTASASAIVYLMRGGIDPLVAGPTAVGVFVGASVGSLTARRVDARLLRLLFVLVLLWTAFEMARRAVAQA